MDNTILRPMDATESDWRTTFKPDDRQKFVNKIMDGLKKQLAVSVSSPEGLVEIATTFEEKMYTTATSQSDYLRKISMTRLAMETKPQTTDTANTKQSNSDGGDAVTTNTKQSNSDGGVAQKPPNPASQSMQSQELNQGQSLIPLLNQQSQAQQLRLFQAQQRLFHEQMQNLLQQQQQQLSQNPQFSYLQLRQQMQNLQQQQQQQSQNPQLRQQMQNLQQQQQQLFQLQQIPQQIPQLIPQLRQQQQIPQLQQQFQQLTLQQQPVQLNGGAYNFPTTRSTTATPWPFQVTSPLETSHQKKQPLLPISLPKTIPPPLQSDANSPSNVVSVASLSTPLLEKDPEKQSFVAESITPYAKQNQHEFLLYCCIIWLFFLTYLHWDKLYFHFKF